jgi:hypothetical protein
MVVGGLSVPRVPPVPASVALESGIVRTVFFAIPNLFPPLV